VARETFTRLTAPIMWTTALPSKPTLIGRLLAVIHRYVEIPPVWFDAVLYGLSSLFALVVALASKIPLYRGWGVFAIAPYAIAAMVGIGIARRARTHDVVRWRAGLAVLVIVGAVIVPLAVEVHWRFGVAPESLHVQPEVVVIERAASFVANGHTPYQAHVISGNLIGRAPGLPAYEAFFPYLPAMVLYGLPAATSLPHQLTDARLFFLLVTLVVVGLSLRFAPGTFNQKLRALQVATAFPWAALAVSTGGDDIPIVALLLAAMVLAQRRRPGWSGLAFGLVCAMKFTAWPVALLALFAARDTAGRRRPLRMALGIAVIVVPLVAVSLVANAAAFGANVLEFPLGLAGIASPAGSALPGHLIVSAFPALRKEFVALCVIIGLATLVWFLIKRPPRDASDACKVAGWSLVVAICLAPSTRIGYLIYPLNLFVWSWMLTTNAADEARGSVGYASAEA
jgi:Glycosyltransferase family 87